MPKITKTESAWFDIPDDEYEGSVEIVHLKDGEIQAIVDELTELSTKFEDSGAKLLKVRQAGINTALAAASIKSWKNHLGENGKQLKCTHANKMTFLKEDGYFQTIEGFRRKLAEDVQKQKEAAEKN